MATASIGDIITLRSNLQSRSYGAPKEIIKTTVGANKLQKSSLDSLTKLDVPALLAEFAELVDPTWKSWYYRRFIALGENKVRELAQRTHEQSKYSKKKYFGTLLRQAE